MRLIDADALIECIKDDLYNSYKDDQWYRLIANALIKVIDDQPTINNWIPCSERLPEKDTDVIVCCYGSDMILTHDGETIQDAVERTNREFVSVTVGFIGSDGWHGADWFPMMVTPTYWMPLPERPTIKEVLQDE